MNEIIIQPKNPLDLTPEEAEELAKAIRISYPRYKVQVKIDGYKGYAVTLYQVITVAVLAGVTEEIAEKYRGGRANEFEKKRLGGTAMSKKWQESVEAWAIFLVWVFGLLMATLPVLGTLPALSEPASLILLISLIVFLCASLIVFVFDM